MALIKCQECGTEVSDKAASCPKCGCPINPPPTETKKKSKAPLFIILLVVIIAAAAIGLIVSGKIGGLSFGPKETVELDEYNFIEYFDVSIDCSSATIDSTVRNSLFGWTDYNFSSDMTVTIKPRVPSVCDNVYITIDPNVDPTKVNDDKCESIKVDKDGYSTTTKKIHANGVSISSYFFSASPFNWDFRNVSGTITFNPEELEQYNADNENIVLGWRRSVGK